MIEVVEEVDKIVEKMAMRLPGFETDIGASASQIFQVEKEFDAVLPRDYKYFLNKFGYVSWDGSDILGICSDSEMKVYFSMPYYTKCDRESILPKHFTQKPSNTVIVGAYGGGGHFFLHCNNSNSPGKVVLLLDELHGKPADESWGSFTDFLRHY